jgi:hypothetical protein
MHNPAWSVPFGTDWNLSAPYTDYDPTWGYTIVLSRANGWSYVWHADSEPDTEALRELFPDMRHCSWSWDGE